MPEKTVEQLILKSLERLETKQDGMDKRMGKMEDVLITVAEQNIELKNVQSQVSTLWEKDAAHTIALTELIKFQSACPREGIEKDINNIKEDLKTTKEGFQDDISLVWKVRLGLISGFLAFMAIVAGIMTTLHKGG